MGIAAYNRGTKVTRERIQALIDASTATKDARALLWRDVLQTGAILTFRAAGGATLVVGPDVKAVGPSGFAGYRYGGDSKWRGDFKSTDPWAMALWIVEHVGRARPYRVAI